MEMWMIVTILAILLILFIVFIVIIYKISKNDGGLFGLKKSGFFLDPDTGAVGSFLCKKYTSEGYVDITYAPLNNPLGKEIIRNVPEKMVPDPVFSSSSDISGVQSDGYVILGAGANGQKRLFNAMNINFESVNSDLLVTINELKKEIVGLKRKNVDATKNEESIIAKHIENKIDEKPKKKTDLYDEIENDYDA